MASTTKEYLGRVAQGALAFLALVVIWQAVATSGLVKPFFLPSPIAVITAFGRLVANEFWKDVLVSVVRISAAFLLATIIAIPLGVMLAINKRAAGLLEPLIDFIRYTPIPAFIPLFILWFGIGETEKIVVIFSAVFFQLVLMVANSVSTVPQALIDFAKTLGASRKEIILKVIFRHAQPRIFKDLRVSMGWAWAGLMLAEIVGATSGIGFVIIQSQRLLQTGNVIAAIITVGVLGVITDVVFRSAHARLFPWSEEEP